MELTTAANLDGNSGDQYAPHVINTPLAFLIRDAMMTNIYGEPGWSGTGWRAARDLVVAVILVGKQGQLTALRMLGSLAMAQMLLLLRGLV